MPSVVFVHGVGDAPGPGQAAALNSWVEILAAAMPEATASWLRANSAMVYFQDWGWYAGDARRPQAPTAIWPSVMAALGSVIDEAQLMYNNVELDKLSDLTEVAPNRADPDPVADATSLLFDKISAFSLWQVPAYLEDWEGSRAAILGRFEDVVSDSTRVIVAHSLGSIIAYEAIHHLGLEIETLVTLGSPIGVPGYVYDRLHPPASVPSSLKRWINVAHPNEPVALVTEIASLFSTKEGGRVVEDVLLKTAGSLPWHAVGTYLGMDEVRRRIWTEIGV